MCCSFELYFELYKRMLQFHVCRVRDRYRYRNCNTFLALLTPDIIFDGRPLTQMKLVFRSMLQSQSKPGAISQLYILTRILGTSFLFFFQIFYFCYRLMIYFQPENLSNRDFYLSHAMLTQVSLKILVVVMPKESFVGTSHRVRGIHLSLAGHFENSLDI